MAGAASAFRVTARDRELLGWVARWGLVTQGQLSRRLGLSRQRTFTRARVLRGEGLLEYERPLDELPGVYSVTPEGIAMAGLERAAGQPARWALWSHLAVLDVVSGLGEAGARAQPGVELITQDAAAITVACLPGGRPLICDALIPLESGRVLGVLGIDPPASWGGLARAGVATLEAADAAVLPEGWDLLVVAPQELAGLVGKLPDRVGVRLVAADAPGRHQP